MPFQRSYSKVWWGSDNQLQSLTTASGSNSNGITGNSNDNVGSSLTTSARFYSYFSQEQQQQQKQHLSSANNNNNSIHSGYHSLDYNSYKSYSGNLSRIQEVDDEHNISKLSATWEKHDSPGSLRSQDSGFSDNDETHSTRSLGRCSSGNKTASPGAKSNKSNSNSSSTASSPSATGRQSPIATPPTVMRRIGSDGNTDFYAPMVNVVRRISFTGATATAQTTTSVAKMQLPQTPTNVNTESSAPTLMEQLDSMILVEEEHEPQHINPLTAKRLNFEGSVTSDLLACQCAKETPAAAAAAGGNSGKQRRRRRVTRKATAPLSPTKRRTLMQQTATDISDEDDEQTGGSSSLDELDSSELNPTKSFKEDTVPPYNNETVYLGDAPPPYNNETVILGGAMSFEDSNNNNTLPHELDETLTSPLKAAATMQHFTSTPKAEEKQRTSRGGNTLPNFLLPLDCNEYENPLLNGHAPALQFWLDDMRRSYEHEVMSTLQTKSIAQEAFKNLTITTNTVAKLIRQLQQSAMQQQFEFERMERVLMGDLPATLAEALTGAEKLVHNVQEFIKVLERRTVFFHDSRSDRRRFEQQLEQLKLIAKDTHISLERQHYINLESLLEDLQLLKRYLLISLRLVFEKLVRVIVQSIEHGGRCDLMLRANINMIATLSNIDYEGFASLTDAFVQCEAVRTLLLICLEHKLSAVRALAFRALATICCAPAAIAQLGNCGGIEVLRDVLQADDSKDMPAGDAKHRIGDMERREAVSLLTQITAAWHGPEHRVDGLRHCAETIVAGITGLITRTSCIQTLLLCAAALNNLSRIEVTSHYSIMSNDTIFKMIEAVEQRGSGVSIFLYEQIVAMLHNMSLNKKCHSHLANGSIINFITSIYQEEFYRVYDYDSRAQSDAQRRTIKAILHTLTRLVHESSLGPELLELQGMPVFLKTALVGATGCSAGAQQILPSTQLSSDSIHNRDISQLARQLLLEQLEHQKQQELQQQQQLLKEQNQKGVDDVSVVTAPNSLVLPKNVGTASTGLTFNLTRHESYV